MADLWNMTEQDIREQREAEKRAQEPELFEDAVADATMQEALSAERAGEEPVESMVQLEEDLSEDPLRTAQEFVVSRESPSFQRENLNARIANEREQQLRERQVERDNTGIGESFGAAWDQTSVTQGVIDWARRDSPKADPDFDYYSNREELEEGLSPANIDWLRSDSVSLEHAQQMRQQALAEQEQSKTMWDGGTAQGVVSMLGAGLADPLGWAAGFGVGKTFQMAGVGSRALYAAGRTGKAVGSIAGEGAIGNVALTAMLDASGKRVDAPDYVAAAAFGTAMGIGTAPFVLRGDRAIATGETHAQLKEVQENYRRQLGEIYDRAVEEAGPGATSEEVSRAAHRIQGEEVAWFDRARTAEVPEDEQILRRSRTRDASRTPNEGTAQTAETPETGDPELRAAEDAYEARIDERRAGDPVLRAEEDAYEARIDERRAGDPELKAEEDAYEARIDERRAGDPELKAEEDAYEEAMRARRGDPELRAAEDDAELRAKENASEMRIAQRQEETRAESDAKLRAEEDASEARIAQRQEEARAAGEEPESTPAEGPATGPRTGEDFDFRLDTPESQQQASKDYGTDLLQTEDPDKAAFINEIIHNAETWVANNPIDEARTSDLLSRAGKLTPYLASTAQNLMRSKHPTAKMYAQLILENTTGAGGRRTNAAMDKYASERTYFKHVEGYETAYKNWRRENGGSTVRDLLSQKMPARFNKELTEYMSAVNRGESPNVSPSTREAAEMLERGYRQMADDQVRVRTAGSENLPFSSAGYFSRRLNAQRVASLTNSQQRALASEFDRQLMDLFDDPELRAQVANRIVNRMKAEAAGGVNPSPNVRSATSTNMVRQALREAGMGAEEADAIVARMRTNGPTYTRNRLDLDLRSTIKDPETGKSFDMADLYEMNQLALYRDYARRVSGEVALARRGIMGKDGLDILRDSFQYGRDGQKLSGEEMDNTLRAFDQTASEMLGVPYGTMTRANTNEWANNLRMLTAMSRLGGMAFTQFAEFANAVPALGVSAAFRGVKMMPRMLKELRSGQKNDMLNSLEQVSGEFGGEYKQIFPFADTDDIFVVSGEEMSVLTRSIRSASRKMQFYNMFHYVAAAQTRGMSEQILSKAMRAVREGRDDVMLDDMGIDATLRADLRRNLDKIADFDEKGNPTRIDVSELDADITHRFATAVNRGAKQIIQGNFVGETGYWAHNDFLKLLTQFRTFSLTSTEKQWARVAGTKGSLKAAGYLVGALGFAVPIHLARIQLASLGREDREEYVDRQTSLPVMARSTLNYLSLSGMLADVMDLSTAGLGTMDTVFGTNMRPDSAYVRGKGGSTLSGIIPSFGYAEDLIQVGRDPTDLGHAVKQLPGGNLPYLVPILNGMGQEEEEGDQRL